MLETALALVPVRTASNAGLARPHTPSAKSGKATPHAGARSGPVPAPTREQHRSGPIPEVTRDENSGKAAAAAGPVPRASLARGARPGVGPRRRAMLIVGLFALAGFCTTLVLFALGAKPEPASQRTLPGPEPLPEVPVAAREKVEEPSPQQGAEVDAGAGAASDGPEGAGHPAPAAVKPVAATKAVKKGKQGKVVVVGAPSDQNSSTFNLAVGREVEDPAPAAGASAKVGYPAALKQADLDMAAIRRMPRASGRWEAEVATKRAQDSGDPVTQGFAWRNFAQFLQDQGACDEAVQAFQTGIKHFENAKVLAGAGLLANDVGMMGHLCRNVDRLEWFKKSVAYRWKANDLQGVRKAANNLGNEYMEIKNYEEADKSYNEALMAATALKDYPGVVKVHANLARVWTELAGGGKVGTKAARVLVSMGSPAWLKAKGHYEEGMAVARRYNLDAWSFCVAWPVESHGYCGQVLEALGLL